MARKHYSPTRLELYRDRETARFNRSQDRRTARIRKSYETGRDYR